eukprot:Nk52_evm49s1810 gene=Nk52_evmTU49s1810
MLGCSAFQILRKASFSSIFNYSTFASVSRTQQARFSVSFPRASVQLNSIRAGKSFTCEGVNVYSNFSAVKQNSTSKIRREAYRFFSRSAAAGGAVKMSSPETKKVTEDSKLSNDDDQPATESLKTSPSYGKETSKSKLRAFLTQYGPIGFTTYISISLANLGLMYCAVRAGLDIPALLESIGLSVSQWISPGASAFVVAYTIHKLMAPIRIAAAISVTPFIVRKLRSFGWISGAVAKGSKAS